MTIRNVTRDTLLAQKAELADTPLKRVKGLLGRNALARGQALVIRPCNSVHMLFMKFAIDVVFVDGQNQVVGLCVNLRPFQLSPIFWKSACAIELPAGTIDWTKTGLGDTINVQTGN